MTPPIWGLSNWSQGPRTYVLHFRAFRAVIHMRVGRESGNVPGEKLKPGPILPVGAKENQEMNSRLPLLLVDTRSVVTACPKHLENPVPTSTLQSTWKHPTILLAATGLLAFIAIPVMKVAQRFKRAQQWQVENGHDRAERREHDWYWNKKQSEKISSTESL